GLPGPGEGDVHRADHQVLDHLLVADDRLVDGDRQDLALAVDGAAAQAAARLAVDGLVGQLFADARHLALDSLRGLEQAFQIRNRHQVLISFSAAPNTSWARRINGCWRASASRARRSAVAASVSCPTSERMAAAAGAAVVIVSLVGRPSTDETTASISARFRSARSAS